MRNGGVLASLCLLGVACGGGDSTGPQVQNIAGTYNYSVPNLSAQGLTCRARATMVLTQHSASFAGTYTGDLVCTASGYYDSTGSAGAVANGGISGDSVYFDFDKTNWHDMGVIAGGRLQGLVNVPISANGTPMGLAGKFTATKQ